MKKIFLIGGGVVLVILIALSVYYRDTIRGAWTPLQPVQELPEAETPDKPDDKPTVNETPKNFKLPEGFTMSVFRENLTNPRTVMIAPNGNIWVTLTSAGKVVEITDKDNNGKGEEMFTLIEGLTKPHGLEKKCMSNTCEYYIAEEKKVSSYTYDEAKHKLILKEKLADLPAGGRHFTRSIIWSSEDQDNLLVSIGSACDVCHEKNPRHGTIEILDVKNKTIKPFATGLRNAVFLANNPLTNEVWTTEMGRDMLGNDLPPDELNILKQDGKYGWPICYGNNIHDTSFDKNTYIRNPCMEPFEIPAEIEIPAHSAPLGLTFIPYEGWPKEYQGDLLVSLHGSWNSTVPVGYKVVRYDFDDNGKLLNTSDFLTGFLDASGKLYGRPTGIVAMPNGKIFLSDDKVGKIYQINYRKL